MLEQPFEGGSVAVDVADEVVHGRLEKALEFSEGGLQA